MKSKGEVRLWPGVALVGAQWAVRYGAPLVNEEWLGPAMMGSLALAVAVLVWWVGFSRVGWMERVGGVVLAGLAVRGAPLFVHESVAGGMMGMMFGLMAAPGLCLALVVWAALRGRMNTGVSWAAMVLLVALACVPWALVRTDGVEGGGRSQLAWRWTPSMEELLLRKLSPGGSMIAAPKKEAAAAAPAPVEAAPVEAAPVEAAPALAAVVAPMPEWPGFRGAQRDSVVRGVRIETDWERSAPEEVWRRAVGPGWSSFAVGGGLIYTQEQRGEDEVVACYRLQDGEPVWAHKERVRFWESNAGAGPRGTPWLGGGKVYALGATGVLTALDARTGGLIWKREVAKEHGVKTPEWGFAGSPLVLGERVLVAVSGTLASYGAADGARQWSVKTGGGSYGSPQRMVLGGVEQVVMQSGTGATGVSAADGRVLWKHAWEGAAMLQPALTEEGDLLMMTGGMSGGEGVKRIGVSGGNTEERWTSRGLKPYFNDLVVHNGHAYGFDGAILSCISLQDGARKWKGGRYGYGQMLLLPEQDALLVLSEEGELALVSATPDGYREMGRRKAIEGKTWNHPALAGGLLLVRNGVEMAAFRLGAASLASSTGGR